MASRHCGNAVSGVPGSVPRGRLHRARHPQCDAGRRASSLTASVWKIARLAGLQSTALRRRPCPGDAGRRLETDW